jgi:hypothetical protein
VRTCVSNRDADPPIQNLLHAVGVLCIGYYAVCQRKGRADSWSGCHSRVEVPRQQAQKKICWDFVHALLELAIWQVSSRPGRTAALLRRAAKRIKKRAVPVPVPAPRRYTAYGRPSQWYFDFLQPDFAPRAPSSRPCISCNKQPAGVLGLAELERKQPQSR